MRFSLKQSNYQQLYNEYDSLIISRGYRTTGGGKMYQTCVKEFLWWLELKKVSKINKVTTKLIREYLFYISSRHKFKGKGRLSQSMINKHFFSLRIFFDYLLDAKIVKSVVHLPSYYQAEPMKRNILTDIEINAIYTICLNKTEKAMLSLAYGCGLRRNEIEQLNCNDIQLNRGCLIVRNGKGDKSREIPLCDRVISYLKDYLINERDNLLIHQTRLEKAYLINQRGYRMSGASANNLLKVIILRTKNQSIIKKEITLHCLRHTITTHLIEHGADMNFVREFLGHSEIDTVHIYARRRRIKRLFSVT